jgi:hypothetical protein
MEAVVAVSDRIYLSPLGFHRDMTVKSLYNKSWLS